MPAYVQGTDFKNVVQGPFSVLDRTAFLMQSDDTNMLICSPKGTGKSTLLSMFAYYFGIPQSSKSSDEKAKTDMFANFAIHEEKKHQAVHRNKHPVVFLDFSEIHGSTFEQLKENLYYYLIKQFLPLASLCEKHALYKSYIEAQAKKDIVSMTVHLLQILNSQYKKIAYVLIDNFDSPLLEGLENDFYAAIKLLLFDLIQQALIKQFDIARFIITETVAHPLTEKQYEYFNCNLTTFARDCFLGMHSGEASKALQLTTIGTAVILEPYAYLSKAGSIFPIIVRLSTHHDMNHQLPCALVTLIKQQYFLRPKIKGLVNGHGVITKINEYSRFPFNDFSELQKDVQKLWAFLFFSGFLRKTTMNKVDHFVLQNSHVKRLFKQAFGSWLEEEEKIVNVPVQQQLMNYESLISKNYVDLPVIIKMLTAYLTAAPHHHQLWRLLSSDIVIDELQVLHPNAALILSSLKPVSTLFPPSNHYRPVITTLYKLQEIDEAQYACMIAIFCSVTNERRLTAIENIKKMAPSTWLALALMHAYDNPDPVVKEAAKAVISMNDMYKKYFELHENDLPQKEITKAASPSSIAGLRLSVS